MQTEAMNGQSDTLHQGDARTNGNRRHLSTADAGGGRWRARSARRVVLLSPAAGPVQPGDQRHVDRQPGTAGPLLWLCHKSGKPLKLKGNLRRFWVRLETKKLFDFNRLTINSPCL
jgi:hypothetical protein